MALKFRKQNSTSSLQSKENTKAFLKTKLSTHRLALWSIIVFEKQHLLYGKGNKGNKGNDWLEDKSTCMSIPYCQHPHVNEDH